MKLIVLSVTLSFPDLYHTQTLTQSICVGQIGYTVIVVIYEQGLFRDLLQLRDGQRAAIQLI